MDVGFFLRAAKHEHLMNNGFSQHIIGYGNLFTAVCYTTVFDQVDGSGRIQITENIYDILPDGSGRAGHEHLPIKRRHACQVHADVANIIKSCTNSVHN